MKLLNEDFDKSGFNYKLVKISDCRKVAIYKQTDKENEALFYYEVIILQSHEDVTVKLGGQEVFYPASESYPSQNSWGKNGFTYMGNELDKAEFKFDELLKELNEKA
jgi:hypothetical protein